MPSKIFLRLASLCSVIEIISKLQCRSFSWKSFYAKCGLASDYNLIKLNLDFVFILTLGHVH